MITFTNMEVVGFIPSFLNEADPRPAKEQINEAYAHGGGWNSFNGFGLGIDSRSELYTLEYEGDPPTHELSRATFRDETLVFFEHSWFAIIQKDGSYDIARLD